PDGNGHTEELMKPGTDKPFFLRHFLAAIAIVGLAAVAGAQAVSPTADGAATVPATATATSTTAGTTATVPATAATTATDEETTPITVQTAAPAAAQNDAAVTSRQAGAPYWAPLGGFEADTHNTGYG